MPTTSLTRRSPQSAEEVQSLDKSARALAAKAQLYDQLKQGNAIASQPGTADGDGAPYLVDFERKATTGESEAAEKADGVASAHSGAGNDVRAEHLYDTCMTSWDMMS